MKIDFNFFPYFFTRNSQFNRKTFFDEIKLDIITVQVEKKLL